MTTEYPTELQEIGNDTAAWYKVNPLAVIYFISKFIKGIANNFIILVPAMIGTYDHVKENPVFASFAALGIFIAVGLIAFVKFLFFRYRLTDDHVQIRSGLVSKAYLDIPFSRIQNVTFEQPFYYRPFNITCVSLDTAGSVKQEAKILAIDIEHAKAIKTTILSHAKEMQHKETTTPVEQSDETLLNERSMKDLVIHGITNNRIWLILLPILPVIDDIGKFISGKLNTIGIDIESLLTVADRPMWQITMIALTITLSVVALLSAMSILGSIISYYDFRLTKLDDRYVRRCGLLTKQETSMKLARLQMVSQKQDWLDCILKRVNLVLEQASQHDFSQQGFVSKDKIIVPSVTVQESIDLTNDAFPNNQLSSVKFKAISKRFLLTYLGYFATGLLTLLLTGSLLLDADTAIKFIVAGYVLLSGLIIARWYRWGIAVDERYLYIRKGYFGVNYYCFPLFKIQQSFIQQSIWQKKQKLCKVQLVLACGAQYVPHVDEILGKKIIDICLYQSETSKQSWM